MATSLNSVGWLRQLPNQLTLARILAIPLLLFIYPIHSPATNVICALLFGAAGLTDILDGYLAWLYGHESRLGALLDPIADKMLSAAALLLLADAQYLPAWICGFLLCRDIAVSGIRLIALEDGYTVQVNAFGKVKTILQDVGIFSLMMGHDFLDIPFRVTGMIAIWLALAVSLYSGYLYLQEFLENSSKSPTEDQSQ